MANVSSDSLSKKDSAVNEQMSQNITSETVDEKQKELYQTLNTVPQNGETEESAMLEKLSKYDYVGDFSEGLARVRLASNRKYGFVNEEGKEVIACIYDDVQDFSKGLARVQLNEQ
jgi:hypothetical protein